MARVWLFCGMNLLKMTRMINQLFICGEESRDDVNVMSSYKFGGGGSNLVAHKVGMLLCAMMLSCVKGRRCNELYHYLWLINKA